MSRLADPLAKLHGVAGWLVARIKRRRFAFLGMVLLLAAILIRSLVMTLTVHHQGHTINVWWIPGDIWGSLRDGQVVVWGDFGHMYQMGTALVSFPGTALLFAPVALVENHFHLSASFPLVIPHPTAWLVLGPYTAVVGSLPLFAADAAAERLGLSWWKRAFLAVGGAVLVFPVLGLWGHPEDAVATGLMAYSLLMAFENREVAAGWLSGAAIGVQPLVLLAFPVVLGAIYAYRGIGGVVGCLIRGGVPSLALLIVPLVAAWHATIHTLLAQPNYPYVDHVTPWTALAPRVSGKGKSIAVAGGPGRLIAFLLSFLLVPFAKKQHRNLVVLLALAALGLDLRCLFESVMDDYYIWPALAFALVAVATSRWWWLLVESLFAFEATAIAELRHLWWGTWWGLVVGGLSAAVGLALWRTWATTTKDASEPLHDPTWSALNQESADGRASIEQIVAG